MSSLKHSVDAEIFATANIWFRFIYIMARLLRICTGWLYCSATARRVALQRSRTDTGTFFAAANHRIISSSLIATFAPSNDHGDGGGGASAGAKYQKSYRLQGRTTEHNNSGVTVTTSTGHFITTDLPTQMGGQNTAAQPVELLLAALMGCTQATALFVGRHIVTIEAATATTAAAKDGKSRQERLLIERLEFDIAASRDERGALQLQLPLQQQQQQQQDPLSLPVVVPSRLQRVSGTITVYAAAAAAANKMKNQQPYQPIGADALKLLQEQTERRCPVANMMMASGCKMDIVWVDGYKNTATTL